jgi:predicted enzyme related to lactoylglutathione lyase
MPPPFGTLEYLYIGTSDFARDCRYYVEVLKAEKVWAFDAFGANVAAFRLCAGPLFLVADHRPAVSCIPVFAVPNLEGCVRELKASGWRSVGEVFGIPNGPCVRFDDPSGNPYALFQNDRPEHMEHGDRDSQRTT